MRNSALVPPRRTLALSCLLMLAAVACSDGSKDGACSGDECALDAGADPITTPTPTPKPAMKDGGIRVNPLSTDASSVELQARVQVNGANTTCGTCAVVLAQAQGGQLPYQYEWSDPSLTGPGPHRVCPTTPTNYTVIVTDSTPVTVGEFTSSAQQVQASGTVSCVADAGIGGLMGCSNSITTVNGGNADAGPPIDNDASIVCPEPGDAGVTFDWQTGTQGTVTNSNYFATGFKAGESYEYSHDRLLPITIGVGDGLTVDVYASNMHCGTSEKLFTLKYDIFTWHQSFCFKPTQDYNYVIVAVHLNGTLFSWEILTGGTICSGCSTQ
ncbi:MAG: hypothetical protein JWN48_1241 [Myxococcaceae bacterium]|nr:hypothetical protein [Myxococcaceae bacterium]